MTDQTQEALRAESEVIQARVHASFDKQGLMRTLGATLQAVSPGAVEIALTPGPALSQQHGFVHAGAVSAIADSAAGYAALTLMPPGAGVLTAEFKINLLAPAAGRRIVARGRVVKAGRTLTLAQAEVFSEGEGGEKLVALLTATLMAVQGREGVGD
ncbi:PaaI family thioesterase [Methylobacterium currus]|uniref:PaaI family thioesterase n=1 Tax=Methylobacterium currus TaxID=2051553 RepID=UPI002F268076